LNQETINHWQEWCAAGRICEVKFLTRSCQLVVVISPLLAIDINASTITISNADIPFSHVVKVTPVSSA
jgi:hypothetical protein